MAAHGAQKPADDELLNHETDLGRSFEAPRRPSLNLYRERSSLDEARPAKADDHDGYSAVKYYSTFQEPGKQLHATHGSAGDLNALEQTENPERVSKDLKRPGGSQKPGRSDIEALLSNPNVRSSSTTTTATASSASKKDNA